MGISSTQSWAQWLNTRVDDGTGADADIAFEQLLAGPLMMCFSTLGMQPLRGEGETGTHDVALRHA